ncbi:hypothetical protein Thal_1353 [Thermocrinis albus DSM 14484]|uniref:Uncharacterized protein n=1 Tax=Thermocrinis albus (strain DSM 14484 / JCM 11386 / HI 11/12) TaxID=638303 RepID=D3SMK4_THEAH|nr:hypothetical protein [Thermocrinis albus]ADC89984.1 hypothetical protein Thal_1353 [Thermocrinis albus DSM 14484]
MGKIKHYLWQFFSFLLAAYGFYLLFLLLWDTFLRINRTMALPLSLGITLSLVLATLVYYLKKGKLPL